MISLCSAPARCPLTTLCLPVSSCSYCSPGLFDASETGNLDQAVEVEDVSLFTSGAVIAVLFSARLYVKQGLPGLSLTYSKLFYLGRDERASEEFKKSTGSSPVQVTGSLMD